MKRSIPKNNSKNKIGGGWEKKNKTAGLKKPNEHTIHYYLRIIRRKIYRNNTLPPYYYVIQPPTTLTLNNHNFVYSPFISIKNIIK